MGEAVIYLLIKGQDVLVEYRKINEKEEMLVPGGGIEEKDKQREGDYREIAMLREVQEELDGNVQILEYRMVGEVIREETGSRFYVFIITKWIGETPRHTIEEGIADGQLEWLQIDSALGVKSGNVSRFALQKAKEYIERISAI